MNLSIIIKAYLAKIFKNYKKINIIYGIHLFGNNLISFINILLYYFKIFLLLLSSLDICLTIILSQQLHA